MKPSFMKQIDYRWSSKRYRTTDGGYPSVGGAGCAEACVANVVDVLIKHITPQTVFKYACKEGYVTANSGTYWSAIPKLLYHYGIKPVDTIPHTEEGRKKLKKYLKKNYWAIAIMHKGIWTNGGHYILAYYMDDNDQVYISDPASYASYRAKNSFHNFWNQQNQSWLIIDPKKYKDKTKPSKTEKVSMYVEDEGAKVRTRRSKDSKAVATLKRNKKLRLTDYKDGWYKIAKGKYKGYFISENRVSKYKHKTRFFKALYDNNVRDGYSLTGTTVISELKKGKTYKSTKQRGRWAWINEKKGWVRINEASGKKYLQEVKK